MKIKRSAGKAKVKKENSERWLLTYSDLITLLLAFFIIMYSIASLNQGKFRQLAESLHTALSGTSTPISFTTSGGEHSLLKNTSLTPEQQGQVAQIVKENRVFSDIYHQLEQYIIDHHLQANVEAVDEPRGIRVAIHSDVLFDNGSDQLRPQALQILKGLVPFLNKVTTRVQVNGYTDSIPIHTQQFPSNWFLSVDRAAGVVSYLIEQGIDPKRLSAQGFSKYRPVASNATASGRQANRRVDIVLLHSWA
ncbi:flagellar motor protein MotB [Sulfoacidibacillus thermotolerans]|uniref:OmpA-like domain-containing protein n=1 Tax=Sulfoacidibacillus thermotolerans TaxID=1765684 RepID=A0A2U3DAV3_SULT2|nr:flagellar motor protein MotB [Sulfoacidibacillus thermotolerans]PWI58410.1 hypothetical protein BM613_04155 [Sulfoacidibacillus thermotolerans]